MKYCAFFWIFLVGCVSTKHQLRVHTIDYFDSSRNRSIPVAFYLPDTASILPNNQLVIFSHGYGQNKGGDNTAYSYLTKNLAEHGFWVASIQHELATDDLIPLTGIPQVVRRPFWERGADNILFVINQVKKTFPNRHFEKIILIGHSNGGDMTALFPQKYPGVVQKIITLDNRRMALPVSAMPEVYSLRSSDQPADPGVLPGEAEQRQFNITIIKLEHTTHNEMDDHASKQQRKEIIRYILGFLAPY